jgi:hypothetical protein
VHCTTTSSMTLRDSQATAGNERYPGSCTYCD